MNIQFYALHPVFFVRRIALKVHEWRNPKEPWLAQGAIEFCRSRMTEKMSAFEWGSGRSTVWFSQRVGRITSIEHHEGWHGHISKQLEVQNLLNVDYRLIPLDHDPSLPTQPIYEKTPLYVSAIDDFSNESLDWIIVDGHYRQACILSAIYKLKNGGYLLVDNTNWLPLIEWGVPSHWPRVHQSENVMTQTTVWQKPR